MRMVVSARILNTVMLCLAVVLVCIAARPQEHRDGESVSLMELIANPMARSGERVRVIGFLSLDPDGEAIYLHEHDYEHGLTLNALRVDLEARLLAEKRSLANKYVVLEGRHVVPKGGARMYSGRIDEVTRLDYYPSRAEVRRNLQGR